MNYGLILALSPNLAGALFMCISMAGFTVNDAIVKYISAEMNMAQVMLVRGAFGTLLIGVLAWRQATLHALPHIFHPMVLLRASGELGATIFFLVALAHLPIANVSAVLQALPLAVTMGAALVLSEPVGWRRWLAIVVGFIGVMVVVKPGLDGFSVYSVAALGSVVCAMIRDLATRSLPQKVPTLLVSMMTSLMVTVAGAVLVAPMGGWTPMTAGSTGALAAAACLLLVGYQFIIHAMRTGQISFIAPFRYTSLLWAILLGFLVFGDVPDLAMITGASIIVASGLYMLYRERVVGKRTAAAGTSPAMVPDGL